MCHYTHFPRSLRAYKLLSVLVCLPVLFYAHQTSRLYSSAVTALHTNCPDPTTLGLPNAFSPNGDGINDQFCIQGWNECIQSFRIMIFNRWGEKVFESTDPDFCWDGKSKGAQGESGEFVYRLEATFTNNLREIRSGTINVIL